jgi:hypothetical protein
MNNPPPQDADKLARFHELAETHANILTGRQFAARRTVIQTILDQPIVSAAQRRKRSRSDALRSRTCFRVVAILADGKRITLRRRSMNAYSHVALYARPGVDSEPEAYLWRLTNGSAQKAFHAGPHSTKWWLVELIPIDVRD